MKNNSVIEKKKKQKKLNKTPGRFKGAKVLNSNIGVTENTYQIKLKKIEEIYKNYINQYSKLEQEKNRLFSNFVKKMEQRKIEILLKEIN